MVCEEGVTLVEAGRSWSKLGAASEAVELGRIRKKRWKGIEVRMSDGRDSAQMQARNTREEMESDPNPNPELSDSGYHTNMDELEEKGVSPTADCFTGCTFGAHGPLRHLSERRGEHCHR